MLNKSFVTRILAMLCLPLASCALDDGPNPDATGDEELGTTWSALCSDGAADATVAFVDKGGYVSATSALPTDNYDHPACSDRYPVEVTGVSQATQPFSVAADWGEALPTTRSACELAMLNVQTHEYKMQPCGGGICLPNYIRSQVGSDITLRGTWLSFFGNHYCGLVADSPLPELQPSAIRDKVRVAVRAYVAAMIFPIYKRGEAGVNSQRPY